ncbi:hypothetical protein C1645_736605 [Glomus cerebriforme]|uniref:Uncharacterized protein n=1 Tax=Glomus cerebriforme TaxID=658196 RepID=A0A397TAW8_9GLOM|nr:hypothetical protein C1645_736605 [Glomus cerebriforme]
MHLRFVLYVAETSTDENWKKAASDLNKDGILKRQAQWEEVKSFWNIIDNEKADIDKRLLEKKLEQAKIQFAIDRSVMGNEAHMITDQTKLDYISFTTLSTSLPGDTPTTPPSQRHEQNENMYDINQDDSQPQDEENHKNAIVGDSGNNFREATESMVGRVERMALIVDGVNLEEIFEEYCSECENNFDLCHSDIMDLRPISQFMEKLPEAIWKKFVTNTYPEYEISGEWEKFIKDFFKPKETLEKWIEAWRGLYAIPEISDKDKSNGKLEVPVESSKHRRNSNINPIFDKVLEAKRADGLARLWQSNEEVLIYEQTGPTDFDDFTQLFIHEYKLARTMRDVLNQRIILRLKDGIPDHKDLASFVLYEKKYRKGKLHTDQKNKLFAKRKVNTVKQNPPTPNRPKKQKR